MKILFDKKICFYISKLNESYFVNDSNGFMDECLDIYNIKKSDIKKIHNLLGKADFALYRKLVLGVFYILRDYFDLYLSNDFDIKNVKNVLCKQEYINDVSKYLNIFNYSSCYVEKSKKLLLSESRFCKIYFYYRHLIFNLQCFFSDMYSEQESEILSEICNFFNNLVFFIEKNELILFHDVVLLDKVNIICNKMFDYYYDKSFFENSDNCWWIAKSDSCLYPKNILMIWKYWYGYIKDGSILKSVENHIEGCNICGEKFMMLLYNEENICSYNHFLKLVDDNVGG